eukprot:g1768.t1
MTVLVTCLRAPSHFMCKWGTSFRRTSVTINGAGNTTHTAITSVAICSLLPDAVCCSVETEAVASPVQALSSPPKRLARVAKRHVMPELCLALPKTRRRRRRNNRDSGDGSGGGNDGNDNGDNWGGDHWENDGDRFWMWFVMTIYSIIQAISLMTSPKQRRVSHSFLAAITASYTKYCNARRESIKGKIMYIS